MKTNIQRKLNAYAAAAGTIAVAGAADAQIIHVDINPDTIVHDSVFYDLNMDGAGPAELKFEAVEYQASSAIVYFTQATVQGNPANAVIGSLYYGAYPMPFPLNNGDSISASNPDWQAQTVNGGVQYLGVIYSTYNYGNWLGVNDKYLGVRFMIGTDTHYGWVRISVSTGSDSITIKEYAYQALPGVGTTAGQLVGIAGHPENNPTYIFASGNTVVLQNTQVAKGGKVRVLNVLGQPVYETEIIEENMRIGLESQTPGIYFVEVQRADGNFVKKVYIH
ncbi:MAG: hypothetical protein FD123_3162 [Bacteroidetes bacterium]|nr:MAG: hypothetical protein FD123_3162 [Bacteroidota bacterium]